jgi:lysophospholipase L1-like esterase
VSDLCIQDSQTVVFIGDSITDCGRRAESKPFGLGYVSLLIEMITADYPERQIQYVNEGIGGDRVTGLRARWHDDVIVHKPDWISVKIGINDLHSHYRDDPEAVSPQIFRECYDVILAQSREKTSAGLILIEPFFISNDTTGLGHRTDILNLIPKYIEIVRQMADKYDARLVKTHEVFQKHLEHRPADFFCPEPVHPFRSGHLVIANELYKALHQ